MEAGELLLWVKVSLMFLSVIVLLGWLERGWTSSIQVTPYRCTTPCFEGDALFINKFVICNNKAKKNKNYLNGNFKYILIFIFLKF